VEADQATARAEEAEAKVKVLEQEHLSKEQEITSLSHKLSILEAENEKIEGQLVTAKQGRLEGESSSKDVENLQRKIQLLEDELDQAEKNVKETMEKCVPPTHVSCRHR
jgi:tropomyosin